MLYAVYCMQLITSLLVCFLPNKFNSMKPVVYVYIICFVCHYVMSISYILSATTLYLYHTFCVPPRYVYIIIFCATTLYSQKTKIVVVQATVQFGTKELCCFKVCKGKSYEICNITRTFLLPSVSVPSKSTIYPAKNFLFTARTGRTCYSAQEVDGYRGRSETLPRKC